MNDLVTLPVSVVFFPAQTFRAIKYYRSSFSYLPVAILLFLTIAVRIGYIFITHFPLTVLEPKDANIFLEIAKFLVPILTWVVASYAVTSIMGGEALAREILIAAAYAMTPYIIFALPIAAASRILCRAELGLFTFLNRAVWAWVVVLFFVSVKSLHDYHVGKTLLVCFLTLFGIALIWALLVLIYALGGNLVAFFRGFVIEAWMTSAIR